MKELSIWGTRCDAPLLVDQAEAAARASCRDILIVRLRAALENRSPVTFDWVPCNRTIPHRCGLLPAMTFGGGLALVADQNEELRLDVSTGGVAVAPLDTSWGLQRPLATARAIAVFSNQLWRGL
jgi:hypothetical protein